MSFLYPRTITVWRLPAQNLAGDQGDIGQTEATLQQVGGGSASMSAAIQMKKDSSSQPAHLPGDISKRVYWELLTPPGTQLITIISNDEIHDDLGKKYQVVGVYLTAMGNQQCMCERIEA